MHSLRATMTIGGLLLMAACAEAPPEIGVLPDAAPPDPAAVVPAAVVPPPVVPDAPPPRIEFAADTYDFGVMPEIETRTGSFTFTNTGGRLLVISDVKASCGCTVPTLARRRYEPGQSGELTVEFEPAGAGKQKKVLNVISNSEPEPLARLTITADVTPFVALEPAMLQVDDLRFGRVNERTVTASCPDPSFVIESVTTSNEHASARVIEPAEGLTRTIVVTIAPTAPWGGFFSWLEITSRARPEPGAEPVTHTRRLRVQGQVSGELTAKPYAFRFGLKPGERFQRRVKVWRPSGAPFALENAELEVTALEDAGVRVERLGPDAYELVLTARAVDRPAPSRGRVTFTTDVPGEERLEIPIVGVVRIGSRGVR